MISNTGYKVTPLKDIIDNLNNILKKVFGKKVNTNPSSPNGQLVQQLATVVQQNENFKAQLFSILNPELSFGIWLDAIASFNGIVRGQSTPTIVVCKCYGSNGVNIPAGTIVADQNNNNFSLLSNVMIGPTGDIDANFICTKNGAIKVYAGTITKIITQIYGFDRVINPNDGITGEDLESDADFKKDRKELLYSQGSASIGSIYAELINKLSLRKSDIIVQENNTDSDMVIGSITLKARSICLVIKVLPSQYESVAKVLYDKKPGGIVMNGDTTATYTDPYSGSTITALFYIPKSVSLQVNIDYTGLKIPTSQINSFKESVKTAIINNFNGKDPNSNLPAIGIFATINVSRFTPSLLAILHGGEYISLTIQLKDAGLAPASSITMKLNELAILTSNEIIITGI